MEVGFDLPSHYTVAHAIEQAIQAVNQRLQESKNDGSLILSVELYTLRRAKKSKKPDLDMPAFDHHNSILRTKEDRFV